MSEAAFPVFVFVSILLTAVLSFVAVIIWITQRRQEREAFYRSETIKKVAESRSPAAALEFLRETDRIQLRRMRAGLRLAGLVLTAAGLGLVGFLAGIDRSGRNLAMAGFIPLLIGIVLFVYGQFFLPKE